MDKGMWTQTYEINLNLTAWIVVNNYLYENTSIMDCL